MRRSIAPLLLTTLLLAACGGSGKPSATTAPPNGEASKSATQVLKDATAAATHAKSVRISGTLTSGGKTISLDLKIANGKGATGTMSVNGAGFALVTLAGKAYIRASDAFYKQFAGPAGAAAAKLLHGKWLEGSATTGQLASLAAFTNLSQLFNQVASVHGTLTNNGATTYQGHSAVAIHSAAQNGTLYVAATGKPYPLALVATGKNKGSIAFSDWNASVSISAPSGAVDVSQLLGG
jgi:hypothetical protein